MQSLALNRAYYRDCVSRVLAAHCPHIARRHAAALIGWGSEVLGQDDPLSKRYGWGPRLALLLTLEDHQAWSQRLRAVLQDRIPVTFLGHPTRYTDPGPPHPTTDPKAHVGIAITTCERLAELYLGIPGAALSVDPLPSREWLLINEERLLRLTAGAVYHDGVGQLTALRERFSYFPDDVWRHRLAYQWTTLGWDIDLIGICAHRGDTLSARAAIARSVERIIAFQSDRAAVPVPDYGHPPPLDPGFFSLDLQAVAQGIRDSIQGELATLPTTVGALDQWVTDQDLLMAPRQLRLLGGVYDCGDPAKELLRRDGPDDVGL